MVCTDAQVRRMMKERAAGKSQEQAAVKANVKSRKTVGKYEKLGKVPSELKVARSALSVSLTEQIQQDQQDSHSSFGVTLLFGLTGLLATVIGHGVTVWPWFG